MKKDLTDITFIIPARIDSGDRLRNCFLTLKYLISKFNTNIFLFENSNKPIINDLIDRFFKNDSNIFYKFQYSESSIFHRTKILNDMLRLVQTEIVCNYDIDIILPESSYLLASKLLKDKLYDVIYPFHHGPKGETKVLLLNSKNNYHLGDNSYLSNFELLENIELYKSNFNFDISSINKFYNNHVLGSGYADFGMCQFFNTKVYRDGFGENEEFVSYGPEDKERYYRFEKFGYKIGRIKDTAYHLEHFRGSNSCHLHPKFTENEELYSNILSLDNINLKKYYEFINK